MKKILVTGATGRTGRHFIKKLKTLSADGEYGFGFVVRNRTELDTEGIDVVGMHYGDLSDSDFVESFVPGYDEVVNIAGIFYTENIVRAARLPGSNVKRIISVHTTGVYSRFKVASAEYARIDAAVGEMIKGSGIGLSILRPTMIYGVMDDPNVSVFIRMTHRLPLIPIVGSGKTMLQPVRCQDVADAVFAVMIHPDKTLGKDYILSGGAPIAIIDMFRTIAGHMGVGRRFIHVPLWIAYSGAWLLRLFSLGRLDYCEKVLRMTEHRTFSHSEASDDFGFDPLDFEHGVADEVREYVNLLK